MLNSARWRSAVVLLGVLLLAFGSVPASAQILTSGTITAADGSVVLPVGGNGAIGAASVTITGTWVGTLSFFVSPAGGSCDVAESLDTNDHSATVTSATANGTWLYVNEGHMELCVTATDWTSGTASVAFTRGVVSKANSSGTFTLSNGPNTDPDGNSLTNELAATLHRHVATGTSTDETEILAVPGVLVGFDAWNANSTTDAYLKCTNATAANTTPGTTAVFYSFLLKANQESGNAAINVAFDTALTCYLSTGKADSDTTAVTSGDIAWHIKTRTTQS